MIVEISEINNRVEIAEIPANQVVVSEVSYHIEVFENNVSVVTVQETKEIVRKEKIISVVSVPEIRTVVTSERGLQGIPGPAGTGATINKYVAGEAIGGHRGVILGADQELYYASRDNFDHRNKVLGITTGAVEEDAIGTVQTYGELTEPSWDWTLDLPIFLGLNGLLTQMPPSTGFSLIVAFPISATKIFIDIKQPILFS